MNFRTPSAAQMEALTNLSDADLMMPIHASALPLEQNPSGIGSTVMQFDSSAEVPGLDELLARAEAVEAVKSTSELPRPAPSPMGVPANENVSPLLRQHGTRLSDSIREVVAENIKTADDLRYALRVFAAHAVNSLRLNRHGVLAQREYERGDNVHLNWQKRISTAVIGEVAAIQAGKHLSPEEFQYLLELVDSNRSGMAQNLAGPDVDVSAMAAGRGTDWRALADEWAEACSSRGTVTFEAGKKTTDWTSYNIEVQPGAGWVLSVYAESHWVPIESSPAGIERAVASRKQVMLARSQSALPFPYLGSVFRDALRASA